MFYDTSSTYREAYGKFLRSGTLLSDGSSSVPFFGLRSFCSFCFLFLVSFVFARARLHNNPAKVFPCGLVSTFLLLSLPFLGSNDCVFPVLPFPCTHSGKVKQASTISSQRCRHKRSPSSDPRLAEVFMIIFGNIDDLHKFSNAFFRDHPALSGPNARAIG